MESKRKIISEYRQTKNFQTPNILRLIFFLQIFLIQFFLIKNEKGTPWQYMLLTWYCPAEHIPQAGAYASFSPCSEHIYCINTKPEINWKRESLKYIVLDCGGLSVFYSTRVKINYKGKKTKTFFIWLEDTFTFGRGYS